MIDSNVIYGFNTAVETIILTTEYMDHLLFPHSYRADYNDLETCIERMMSDNNAVTVSVSVYAQYLANGVGYESAQNFPCAWMRTSFIEVLLLCSLKEIHC